MVSNVYELARCRRSQKENRKKVHTADEERVPSKDGLVPAVLHEEADAVLRVAGRVDALDADGPQLEDLIVGRCPCHALAVFAADDVYLGVVQRGQLKLRRSDVSKQSLRGGGRGGFKSKLASFLFPPA